MEAFDWNSGAVDPSLYENFLWMMPGFMAEDCDIVRPDFAETECSESAMHFLDASFITDEAAMPGFWPMFYPQEQTDLKPQPPLPKPVLHYNSSKRVGTLSYEERHIKVQKYYEKRSRRSFAKKIAYNCRKRVADSRIRVKGRFVTKAQAQALKGLESTKHRVAHSPS
jgi:hypothetical protein